VFSVRVIVRSVRAIVFSTFETALSIRSRKPSAVAAVGAVNAIMDAKARTECFMAAPENL